MSVPVDLVPVDLLVFPDADLMDVTGPLEALLTANRLRQRAGEPDLFATTIVGTQAGPIPVFGGLAVVPQRAIDDPAAAATIVIVPGAVNVARVRDPAVTSAVAQYAASGATIASVCTGAFALADTCLLRDLPWTTHWEDVATLAEHPEVGAPDRTGARVVDSGPVITAGGLTCGIDLGLHLVAKYGNDTLSAAVARQLDYR